MWREQLQNILTKKKKISVQMADTFFFFFNEYDFGGSDCFTSLLLCDVGVMMGVGAVGESCSSL